MSNILVFNGSPRKNGDTAKLLGSLLDQLKGQEIHVVETYRAKISPCVDCRCCWEKPFCAISDDMQQVYQWIQEADWIILASPVHFDEVSGSLLQVMSRLQLYWMARQKRGEELLPEKIRRGAALLAAGGPGKAQAAQDMTKRLLHCMGASDVCIIHCKNTDRIAVEDNAAVLRQLKELAERINYTI